MIKGKLTIAGLGPGQTEDLTPAVASALHEADVVIGYKYYFRFIGNYIRPDTLCVDTGMRQERQRAEEAFVHALEGKKVCIISSGDAGIYGMAPLVMEMRHEKGTDVEVEVLPGISAFQKAASLLGAPIGHDLCLISLSDLMTPWRVIEKRIRAAAEADFVTAIYNPKSGGRYWQLYRLQEIFLSCREGNTPVGYVRQAGRPEQVVHLTTLEEFDPEQVDMFTVVLIGNSRSFISDGRFITPRGYFREDLPQEVVGTGQKIMTESFRTIERELGDNNLPIDRKWLLLHAIHTTADFQMKQLLWFNDGAVETLHLRLSEGQISTIVTDVTMAASGIRKGALARMGIELCCYLQDPRAETMAKAENITRAQAGMRLAVQEHPEALFVFGNAPTALMELCELIRRGKASPGGIIAAPVGFVHVEESKQMVKPLKDIPRIIIEGRKGGSNLAATLTNAVLCFDDAVMLRPGRDV